MAIRLAFRLYREFGHACPPLGSDVGRCRCDTLAQYAGHARFTPPSVYAAGDQVAFACFVDHQVAAATEGRTGVDNLRLPRPAQRLLGGSLVPFKAPVTLPPGATAGWAQSAQAPLPSSCRVVVSRNQRECRVSVR